MADIEAYLDLLDIDEEQIGIVLGPRINETLECAELEVDVRAAAAADEEV